MMPPQLQENILEHMITSVEHDQDNAHAVPLTASLENHHHEQLMSDNVHQ